MPTQRIDWTPEMIAALRSMRGQGMSLYKCAERIGVAYPTAVYKARELGLAGRMRRPGPLDENRRPHPDRPVLQQDDGGYVALMTGSPITLKAAP